MKMFCKASFLFLTLLVGSYAFPLEDEQDMSIFFDHPDSSARIVGGVQAGSVPYMVALTNGNFKSLVCGASLISTRHMLTAAHCIEAVYPGSLSPTLRGVVGSSRWNSGGVQYSFSSNFTHPNYVLSVIKNDIGILVTSSNVALSNAVRIVPLTYDFIGGDIAVRVYGWGRTAHGGSLSPNLLELRSNTVDGNRCIQEVRRKAQELNIRAPPVQPHIEICIFVGVNKGTCPGDSGSPLVLENNGKQIGVVSWGIACARGAPDMFARVSAYRSWIQNIVK